MAAGGRRSGSSHFEVAMMKRMPAMLVGTPSTITPQKRAASESSVTPMADIHARFSGTDQ